MVATDDDLMGMGKCFEEVVKARNVLQCSADGHVTSKNKKVSIRNVYLLVEHMGVTKCYYFHVLRVLRHSTFLLVFSVFVSVAACFPKSVIITPTAL